MATYRLEDDDALVGIRHRSEDSVHQCSIRRLSGAWIKTEDDLDEQQTLLIVAEGRSPPAVGREPATQAPSWSGDWSASLDRMCSRSLAGSKTRKPGEERRESA